MLYTIYGVTSCTYGKNIIRIDILDGLDKNIIHSKLPITWLQQEKINNFKFKIMTNTESKMELNMMMVKLKNH